MKFKLVEAFIDHYRENIDKMYAYAIEHPTYFKDNDLHDAINNLSEESVITIPDTYCKDPENVTEEEAEKYINDLISNMRNFDKLKLMYPVLLEENKNSQICCICKKPFEGYGNNAEPVCSGSCCDECNMKEVIPARMKMLDDASSEDIDEAVLNEDLNKEFVELEAFKNSWKDLKLTEEDLRDLQNEILTQRNKWIPLGSDVYKIYFAPKSWNKGSRESLRAIYIELIRKDQIYLAYAFNKADDANITNKELNLFRTIANGMNKEEKNK